MLYKDIYNIINEYLYNVEIKDENTIRYKCSQCREFNYPFLLKQPISQLNTGNHIHCEKCRIRLKNYFVFYYN